MWWPTDINRMRRRNCVNPCKSLLTRTFPVAVAGLLNSDRRHVVAAGRQLLFVTADFAALHSHYSAGVAQKRVAAIGQQPRLPGLKNVNATR